MKIGFFDSGLGGLLLLRAVSKVLPEYDYYYYGDTKNLPYGDKSDAQILEFTKQALEYLFAYECALVIVACNTASVKAVRELQDNWLLKKYPDRKLLGIVIPTVEYLLDNLNSSKQKVLLLATDLTVKSGKYKNELQQRKVDNLIFYEKATPDLVPLIESGNFGTATKRAVSYITEEGREVDSVVLGCSHYIKIKKHIQEKMPSRKIIGQDEIIPYKLKTYLEKHQEIEEILSKNYNRQIYLTEHKDNYDTLIKEFLI